MEKKITILLVVGLGAFLILVLFLLYLVTFTFPTDSQAVCIFTQPSLSCNEQAHEFIGKNGESVVLRFHLTNHEDQGIIVVGALCTDNFPGSITKSDIKFFQDPSDVILLKEGESAVLAVTCTSLNGTAIDYQPSKFFKGSLAVLFRKQNESTYGMSVATVTGEAP